jgi:hypothetical protein
VTLHLPVEAFARCRAAGRSPQASVGPQSAVRSCSCSSGACRAC